ncbi:hypothetical protein AYO21_08666 [Fonsecaea monophora]|uniref:Uncharacterized protein n=1 Tax=Fonsecaea monophora TaxID=254056 RepID=A0A177F0K5_9EURO|nr:hypothetical protein AYO21_08666 [Fonsecaea monophora]OAG37131.1 hypothetical protein AYO21_08666 [Fonsecaea monophora]
MVSKLDVSGPGLMLVFCQVTRPDLVSEGLFAAWYEEEHIPEATSTSGMPAGFRYYCLGPPNGRPWLALYPCPELDFVNSEEYKSIRVTSDMLPTETSFDVADFDVRYYSRWQIHEPPNTKEGRSPFVIVYAVDPPEGADEEFDNWYKTEHLEELAKCSGYRRTTRYKCVYARHNRDDRLGKPSPHRPRWLALDEFDTKPIQEELDTARGTAKAKAILAKSKVEVGLYKLQKSYGKANMPF